MATVSRKYFVPLSLVVFHSITWALAAYLRLEWDCFAVSPAASSAISAAVLIVGGADLGLVGAWAGLSSHRPVARCFVCAVCIVCWCGIYEPHMNWLLRDWSYLGHFRRQYASFVELTALFGLAVLVILDLAGALIMIRRRGAQFKRMMLDDLRCEADARQFQVSHLLMLATVLSLVLGFSVNSRNWLSRFVSMRWHFAAYAPIYSAETVILSAFTLVITTLASIWAALGCGRPWLRLISASATGAFVGFCWAFSFTSPEDRDHLISNGLFSAVVGFLQALLISAALLIIRFRGYRILPAFNRPPA
jgi:uncharacterized Tic20 family protein